MWRAAHPKHCCGVTDVVSSSQGQIIRQSQTKEVTSDTEVTRHHVQGASANGSFSNAVHTLPPGQNEPYNTIGFLSSGLVQTAAHLGLFTLDCSARGQRISLMSAGRADGYVFVIDSLDRPGLIFLFDLLDFAALSSPLPVCLRWPQPFLALSLVSFCFLNSYF